MSWTSPADIKAKVRRRWDDGSLLRAVAACEPFPVIDLPLRGPKPAEIGDDLGAVQAWVADLTAGAGSREQIRYELEHAVVGGRLVGRNRLPSRVRIASYGQAWALLGVGTEVAAYERLLALADAEPVVRDWVGREPLPALALGEEWPVLLRAYRWLDDARDSGRYLREIDAPGVDTKFVERRRPVLAALLGVPATGFVGALGLQAKPELVRLRIDPSLGVFGGLSDLSTRVVELAAAPIRARTAVIVENEITFLTIPVPAGGVVLWGKGFEVDRTGSLPWLADTEVRYWGDLDTHGFAILNRLRAWLPQTQSFLMDRDTLLQHRDRWGQESKPTNAFLTQLAEPESSLYADLVNGRWGVAVRLEQERIDWAWVAARLPYDVA